jgi:hypothetical protein
MLTTRAAAIRLNRVRVGNNGERCMGVLDGEGEGLAQKPSATGIIPVAR